MLRKLDLFGEDANVSVRIRQSGEFIDPRLIAGTRVLLTNAILNVRSSSFPKRLDSRTSLWMRFT